MPSTSSTRSSATSWRAAELLYLGAVFGEFSARPRLREVDFPPSLSDGGIAVPWLHVSRGPNITSYNIGELQSADSTRPALKSTQEFRQELRQPCVEKQSGLKWPFQLGFSGNLSKGGPLRDLHEPSQLRMDCCRAPGLGRNWIGFAGPNFNAARPASARPSASA